MLQDTETETDTDELISRFAELGKKDRQAILQQLPQEDRARVEGAFRDYLKREAAEFDRQQRIDRQFHGYSPWLASLIEAAENSVPDGVTEFASRQAWETHSALVTSQGSHEGSGWTGLFDRLAEWFGPLRKNSQ